jgi:hypothetical protein
MFFRQDLLHAGCAYPAASNLRLHCYVDGPALAQAEALVDPKTGAAIVERADDRTWHLIDIAAGCPAMDGVFVTYA